MIHLQCTGSITHTHFPSDVPRKPVDRCHHNIVMVKSIGHIVKIWFVTAPVTIHHDVGLHTWRNWGCLCCFMSCVSSAYSGPAKAPFWRIIDSYCSNQKMTQTHTIPPPSLSDVEHVCVYMEMKVIGDHKDLERYAFYWDRARERETVESVVH